MKRIELRRSALLRGIILNLISLLLILFFALPVFYLISSTFMTRMEIWSARIFPTKIRLENIIIALVDFNMLHYFFNSVFFATLVVASNLFFCSLSGYALAKFTFPGKRVLFAFVLGSMLIPPMVLIVPLFIEVRAMGFLNTPLAMIVPLFVNPFGVFLMRQYLIDLSDDHLDAARIEGASELGVFLKVVVPFGLPAMLTLALYRFLFVWNDLLWPMLVVGGERWRTLPVAIQKFDAQYFDATELKLATAFVAVFPILLLLLFFSKRIYSAMTKSGGLKY